MKYLPVALLMLTACSSPQAPCPTLPTPRQYSRLDQLNIAAEHNALPGDDILRTVLDEWETTRRALK